MNRQQRRRLAQRRNILGRQIEKLEEEKRRRERERQARLGVIYDEIADRDVDG